MQIDGGSSTFYEFQMCMFVERSPSHSPFFSVKLLADRLDGSGGAGVLAGGWAGRAEKSPDLLVLRLYRDYPA